MLVFDTEGIARVVSVLVFDVMREMARGPPSRPEHPAGLPQCMRKPFMHAEEALGALSTSSLRG